MYDVFLLYIFFRQTMFIPNTLYITHLPHQAYVPKKYPIANTSYTKKYLNIPHNWRVMWCFFIL